MTASSLLGSRNNNGFHQVLATALEKEDEDGSKVQDW